MNEEIKVAIETITPEAAAKMLQHSVGNFRKIDRNRVAKYAAEMTGGKWMFNGETIKLNGESVIDGQHRLAAVVKSGVTIESVVIRNLDKMTGVTIDCGKGRTLSDWVKYRGIKNAVSVTSMARNLCCIKQGDGALKVCLPPIQKTVKLLSTLNLTMTVYKHRTICLIHVRRSFLVPFLARCW